MLFWESFAGSPIHPPPLCALKANFPKTWFASTHVGCQIPGVGSKTTLPLHLLHGRCRVDRSKKWWHRELRIRGRVSCFSYVPFVRRTSTLYRGVTTTSLITRNRPWDLSTYHHLENSHVTCAPITPSWHGNLGVVFNNQINKRQKLNWCLEHITTQSRIIASDKSHDIYKKTWNLSEWARVCGNLRSPLFVSCEE